MAAKVNRIGHYISVIILKALGYGIAGEAGKSLVVILDIGKWTDYNSSVHYGDMLGLIYWTLANQNWAEAFKIAKEYIGDIDYKNQRNIVETANDDKTQRYNKHQKFAYKIWNDADVTIGEAGQKYIKSRKLYIPEYYSKYKIRYVAKLKHIHATTPLSFCIWWTRSGEKNSIYGGYGCR
ncbi:MAG: hypothetical protein HRU28_16520 [Rhizobiales bacterium]|nr:hypothetical protein [Hyphomicrobiales bacterium]